MAEVLKSVSDALVETVRAAERSVVRVEARQRLPASGVVWSADGVVVTTSHAVEREADIRVGLADGRSVPARFAGRDPGTDLAVLRAEATGLAQPAWAPAADLAVGGLVLALGRPGDRILATLGILSALDEGWRTPQGGYIDHYVQSDAVMYPGFSGGALIDAQQRVVGVTSSGLVGGLSLALPLPTVQRTVEALLAHRRVRRGYLGVTAQAVNLPDVLRERLGQETGLLLIQVESGSPAEKSRLVQGDTLVTLNGQPLRSLGDLMRVLNGEQADARVPARLVRGGALQEVEIALGERPN